MSIQKFEDIEAWQEARKLTNMVYESTEGLRDFGLRDQIQRASVSVMANIAEGFSSQSNPAFLKYLYISLASASETQSHLYVLIDRKFIEQPRFDKLYTQASQSIKLIRGFIKYLKTHQKPD